MPIDIYFLPPLLQIFGRVRFFAAIDYYILNMV